MILLGTLVYIYLSKTLLSVLLIYTLECCSVAKSCPTLCDPMECSTLVSPVFTVSWSLLRFICIESVMLSSHFIFCHPLLLSSVFPCIRVFSSESALHIWWPKCWSFSVSISPFDEYSELVSFSVQKLMSLISSHGTNRRTDVEAETPLLWLSDAKNCLIGKDPDSGKD